MEISQIGDITVNDYVLVENKVCKVTGISISSHMVECETFPGNYENIPLAYISFIRITDFFLKENDFRDVGFNPEFACQMYFYKDSRINILFYPTSDCANIMVFDHFIRIYCVHELQHALRIVGLAKLANNLKF